MHLLNCKGGDPLARQLGLNKLEFCLAILEQLQRTFTSASLYRGLFSEAVRHIVHESSAQANEPQKIDPGSSVPNDASMENFVTPFTFDDGTINALMDEAYFNFWEPLNRLG